jgi:hypothetical protein
MLKILTLLVNAGLGNFIDKLADVYKRKAELEVDKEKLRSELTAEYLKQIVEDGRIMADLQVKKMGFPFFWVLVGLFTVPLGLWWTAVILDSIFGFQADVANLPTPEMRQWAGDMIKWIFYVGSGVIGFKALTGR